MNLETKHEQAKTTCKKQGRKHAVETRGHKFYFVEAEILSTEKREAPRNMVEALYTNRSNISTNKAWKVPNYYSGILKTQLQSYNLITGIGFDLYQLRP